MNNHIEWDVAEVLDYDYTYAYILEDTGKSNVNNLFALRVKTCGTLYNNRIIKPVKPANNSIKRIPLVGELVLIYKTHNEQSTRFKRRDDWYYVGTVDVHGSVNLNSLPGIAGDKGYEEIDKIKPGRTFITSSISPLQPFEGDLMIEGRSGNSIRFSSTINLTTTDPTVSENNLLVNNYYSVAPSWSKSDIGQDGDPIIVFSNGRQKLSNKQLIVEDPNTDASSLYLTSTQNVPINLSQPETKFNNLQGSQFIGAADKIILTAKNDIVLIDSKKAIVLNTTGDVRIGSSDADEPMVHGKVLESILQKIITHLLTTGIKCGNFDGGFTNDTLIGQCQDLLANLTSKNYRIKKT
jgi:hypothetical protein